MKSKTIKELYSELTEKLAKLDVSSPTAEAKMVIETLFNKDFRLLLFDDCEINNTTLAQINDIIERRSKNEPIQYILGLAPFYNFELIVNKNVLIPRAETELLVDFAIEKLPKNGKLLDVGCGSGTIAVTVAYERSDANIMAVDISSEAISVAKQNAERHKVKNIKFAKSNLLENIDSNIKFDIITANLPYIPENEYLECASEVRDYEPKLALVADDEGLALIYKLAKVAPDFLNSHGYIIFEIGHNQSERLIKFLKELNSYVSVGIIKDYNQFNRFIYAAIS